MRTKDGLKALEEVQVIYNYLYMSKEHYISYKNTWDKTVHLYMNESYMLYTVTPDITPDIKSGFDQGLNGLISLVEYMKETKVDKWGRTMTQWEYIKSITMANMSLNMNL